MNNGQRVNPEFIPLLYIYFPTLNSLLILLFLMCETLAFCLIPTEGGEEKPWVKT